MKMVASGIEQTSFIEMKILLFKISGVANSGLREPNLATRKH